MNDGNRTLLDSAIADLGYVQWALDGLLRAPELSEEESRIYEQVASSTRKSLAALEELRARVTSVERPT